MDWALVINSNRDRLLQIIAALLAFAGLTDGKIAMLPRHVHHTILLVLRPAESAVRRLIIIAAQGLMLKARASRPFPAGIQIVPAPSAVQTPAFCLIDPLKRFSPEELEDSDGLLPRISLPGVFDPVFPAPQPVLSADELLNAAPILHRLAALQRALNNLPREARRLARWQARQGLSLQRNAPFKLQRLSPFRPGLPPGYRKHHLHPVDAVLGDCHYFALEACAADTS